jgi:hypothetical protein
MARESIRIQFRLSSRWRYYVLIRGAIQLGAFKTIALSLQDLESLDSTYMRAE